MKMLHLFFFGLGLFFAENPALAQDECAVALVRDKRNFYSRDISALAIMRLVDTSQSNNEGGEVDWESLNPNGYFEGSAGYVSNQSNQYFENSTLDWTEDRLKSVATQTLSANAVEAYNNCLDRYSFGPQISIFNATDNQATVRIRWVAHPGAPTTISGVEITLRNGSTSTRLPSMWQTQQVFDFIVDRIPNTDMRIVANFGISSDNAFLSRPVAVNPPQRVAELRLGSCIGRGGIRDVRFWGPEGEDCSGQYPWGKYDAQVRVVRSMGSCIGRGSVQDIRLYGPTGEPCGGFPAWGVYQPSIDITERGVSACRAGNSNMTDHVLWGPTGLACGGLWSNRTYSEDTHRPQ
jgi:hypothetical protein